MDDEGRRFMIGISMVLLGAWCIGYALSHLAGGL